MDGSVSPASPGDGSGVTTALVCNVQHYSLHDGAGIRTVVFLKGCPLRCRWCCNPESQSFDPEVSLVANGCLGHAQCGWCARRNPSLVEFDDRGLALPNRAALAAADDVYGACNTLEHSCPSRALRLEGKRRDVADVLAEVLKDEAFYGQDGGLTVSGGEPLAHQPFLCELLAAAQKARLNTAIETCGHAPWEALELAAEHVNEILFDVKCLDSKRHRIWTGAGNEQILDNLTKLCETHPELPKLVRTPIIPGFNDSIADVRAIIDFLDTLGGAKANISYQPLPYHRFGEGKYAALGRPYPMENTVLDDKVFAHITQLVLNSGLAAPALNAQPTMATGQKDS